MGFVMPAALEFYTYVAVGPRNDRKLSVHSIDFDESRSFDLDDLALRSKRTLERLCARSRGSAAGERKRHSRRKPGHQG